MALIDSAGVEWDESIHTPTKSVDENGEWKKKKITKKKKTEAPQVKKVAKAPAKARPAADDPKPECFGQHEPVAECVKCWHHRECRK